ncbi:MAG: hypothetical protein M3421_07440 [Bacteroidota bacterium]|nr:hypothetical protein [Bacteroidota bacterium]
MQTQTHTKSEITPRYGDGFKILSGNQPFVSWDEPLLSLLQKDEVEILIAGNGRSYAFIAHPVQIGGLLITQTMASTYLPIQQAPYNQRMDVPAEEFHANIGTENLTTSHYQYLRRLLQMDLGDPIHTYYHGHEKYVDFTFFTAGIFMTIASNYSPAHPESTTIRIRNHREYRQLLIDREMANHLHTATVLPLDIEELGMPGEYRKYDYIKGRPWEWTEKHGAIPLIWLDENAYIGFSAGMFAQRIPMADLVSLHIQRFQPARGPGYAEFDVKLKKTDEHRRLVFYHSSWTAFDNHIQHIQDFTGLPIEVDTFNDV